MITDSDPENKISSNNNTVFALQQKMFSRSFFRLIFINREKIEADKIENDQVDFNRVLGIDYNLQSKRQVTGLENSGIINHLNEKIMKIIFRMDLVKL